MENKAKPLVVGTVNPERERTYEDFDPYCKWNGRRDMVEVHLLDLGFRKEHLTVRTSSRGILTIHGERPPNEKNSNIWSRFHKEIILAEDCDPNKVSATLARGVLTVRMPCKKDERQAINTRQRRSPLLSGFNVGKGVAVKLVVAVALVVALGFGAYLVKRYKHGHCTSLY